MQKPKALLLGQHVLPLGQRTRVLGVVNATPDSFYDRGRYFDPADASKAIARARALIQEGADLIDVGGETAQPSSPVLPVEEEIRRVVPVIRALAAETLLPISVDTYKPEVARAAVEAGASLINDTSGLADPRLIEVAAQSGAGLVIMHIPCHPKERKEPGYAHPVAAVRDFLLEKGRQAEAGGVARARILLDPGIGFGKTKDENLELIAQTQVFASLGYALLFACSRRTFLGELMGGEPPEERLEATAAVNAQAMLAGADLVRVHDVRFMAKMARMMGLIAGARARAGARGP